MATTTDDYHPISHFCQALPGSRGAARLHPATVTRWILSGVATPTGRVRLAAIRAGSRWLIRESNFAEFLETLTDRMLPAGASNVEETRTPNAQKKSSAAAARALKDKYGI